MSDCSICFDTFNKTTKKQTKCSYCDASVCRACIQQFLLMDTATDPVCPSCRAAWSYDFLTDHLTKSFRTGEYKTHREKVLVDRERARFPETQEQAAAYKNAIEFIKPLDEEVGRLRLQMREDPASKAFDTGAAAFRKHMNEMPFKDRMTYYSSPEYRRRVHDLDVLKLRKNTAIEPACKRIRQIYRNTRQHRELRDNYGIVLRGNQGVQEQTEKERREFIRKCPSNACEGFLSTALKCGLCGIQACKDCHEIKQDNHVCNPATVETIKAIAKEAKPCPNCASSISKIDGCDQMWCTQCKTAFSWRTGKIETNIVHNPHYFQWMRETGQTIARNPGDIPCNVPDRLERHMSRNPFIADPNRNDLLNYLNNINHLRMIDWRNHRHSLEHLETGEWRRQLRVKRMVNEVTEDAWKTTLQKQEKALHKERAKVQLLDMYTNSAYDILSQLLNDEPKPSEQVLSELTQLYTFVEAENEKIHKAYGTVSINLKPVRPIQASPVPPLDLTNAQRELVNV